MHQAPGEYEAHTIKHPADNIYLMYSSSEMLDISSSVLSSESGRLPQSRSFVPIKNMQITTILTRIYQFNKIFPKKDTTVATGKSSKGSIVPSSSSLHWRRSY